MFYRKVKEIERLNQELLAARGTLRAERNAAALEGTKLTFYTERIKELVFEKKALADMLPDSNFRYTVLESVLKQLQVNVKLPARKK